MLRFMFYEMPFHSWFTAIKYEQDDYISGRWITFDKVNRFHNLIENLQAQRIDLDSAKHHFFFMTDEQLIDTLCAFDRALDSTNFFCLNLGLSRATYDNTGWFDKLSDKVRRFVTRRDPNIRNFTDYDPLNLSHILRLLRNMWVHFKDRGNEELQVDIGPRPAEFLYYFTSRYPAFVSYIFVEVSRFRSVENGKMSFLHHSKLVDLQHNQHYILPTEYENLNWKDCEMMTSVSLENYNTEISMEKMKTYVRDYAHSSADPGYNPEIWK